MVLDWWSDWEQIPRHDRIVTMVILGLVGRIVRLVCRFGVYSMNPQRLVSGQKTTNPLPVTFWADTEPKYRLSLEL